MVDHTGLNYRSPAINLVPAQVGQPRSAAGVDRPSGRDTSLGVGRAGRPSAPSGGVLHRPSTYGSGAVARQGMACRHHVWHKRPMNPGCSPSGLAFVVCALAAARSAISAPSACPRSTMSDRRGRGQATTNSVSPVQSIHRSPCAASRRSPGSFNAADTAGLNAAYPNTGRSSQMWPTTSFNAAPKTISPIKGSHTSPTSGRRSRTADDRHAAAATVATPHATTAVTTGHRIAASKMPTPADPTHRTRRRTIDTLSTDSPTRVNHRTGSAELGFMCRGASRRAGRSARRRPPLVPSMSGGATPSSVTMDSANRVIC